MSSKSNLAQGRAKTSDDLRCTNEDVLFERTENYFDNYLLLTDIYDYAYY